MKKTILSFFAVFISLLFSGCKEFEQFMDETEKMRVSTIGYWNGDVVSPALSTETENLLSGMACVIYEGGKNQVAPAANASPLTAHASQENSFSLNSVARNTDAAVYTDTSMNILVLWDGFLLIDQEGSYTFALNNGESRCNNIAILLNGNKLFNFLANHQKPELRKRSGQTWLKLSKGYYRVTIVGAYGQGYENGNSPEQHFILKRHGESSAEKTLSPNNFVHINEDAANDESLKPLLPEFKVQEN